MTKNVQIMHRWILFVFLFVFNTASAQFVQLNDTSMINWINYEYPGAIVNGLLDTTNASLINDSHISISFLFEPYGDLDGLRFFKGARTFICTNIDIDSISEFPPNIESIVIPNLNLTTLPSLPSKVKDFRCWGNQLTTIPNIPATITNIMCSDNLMTHLPAIPSNSVLNTLLCQDNLLTSLPVLPASLSTLYCWNNQLTALPAFPSFLSVVLCSNNLLTSLPPMDFFPSVIECDGNLITHIDSLPSSMIAFRCQDNLISTLPELPQSLKKLRCDSNQLTCLPTLPPSLEELRYVGASNSITCFPNYVVNYKTALSDPLLPLCDPYSTCTSNANIGGKVYFDANSNNIYDTGDSLIDNLTIEITPGNLLVGVYRGRWGYPVDTATNYSIKYSDSIPYFSINPASYNVNVSSVNPIDTNLNFGLQSTGTFEDLSIDIISLAGFARPGFTYKARLYYENIGTVIQQPVITLNYPSNDVSYISSSLSPSSQSAGLLTYQLGTLGLFANNYIDVLFQVSSTLSLNSVLQFTANISPQINDPTPWNNMQTHYVQVRGSFDPNDKDVNRFTLTPSEVAGKTYLKYLIRFQNTGNASAINVRLEDSLSAFLDHSTTEFLSSSHSCKWFLNNGSLLVRYDNINLPDSNQNEELSHGYFKYRVKVKGNLALGDKILNTADIYFDFNAPIKTNTVVTEVSLLSDVENRIESESITIYPNPVSGTMTVNWQPTLSFKKMYFTDTAGRILVVKKINLNQNQISLNIDEYSSGLYILNLIGEENSVCKSIIKHR